MMKIETYVPVIIPTLNRFEHFQRCLLSLQKNTLAKYTEVYISVDYPPCDKYIDGWLQIKRFLEDGINGFQKINIFYQEENLGEHDNFLFLISKVSQKYDVWISSEDDNEFSGNFLLYMNQAVEYMRNDASIYSVCGHLSFSNSNIIDMITDRNYTCFKIQTLDAWGHAFLLSRGNHARNEISFDYLEKIIIDRKKRNKLKRHSRDLYRYCVFGVLGKVDAMLSKDKSKIIPMDITTGIYMIMNDLYQLQPVVSKVRNWGNDGSGLHCGVDATIQEQVIDEETDFELNVLPLHLYQAEIKEAEKCHVEPWNWQYLLACILNVVYCLFGKKVASICYDEAFELYRFIKGVKNGKDA